MPPHLLIWARTGEPRLIDYQVWRRWFEDGGEAQMKIKCTHAKGGKSAVQFYETIINDGDGGNVSRNWSTSPWFGVLGTRRAK
jgi:hypothetical protein